MKSKTLKNILATALISLIGFNSFAQLEKNEVYLFVCETATAPLAQQLVVKYVTVEEAQGVFQYFTVEAEAGNGVINNLDGEGEHMKYLSTLMSSQSATADEFTTDGRGNYSLFTRYDGLKTASEVELQMVLQVGGKYDGMFKFQFDGAGVLFDAFYNEFEQVMSDSNLYASNQSPLCYSHPDLRNFLGR